MMMLSVASCALGGASASCLGLNPYLIEDSRHTGRRAADPTRWKPPTPVASGNDRISAMTASIRVGGREDAAAIADVHVASWRAGYSGVVPAEVLDSSGFESDRRSVWNDWRFHPSQRVTVSVDTDDDRIVGFALYGPERDRGRGHTGRGELYAFYFHPDVWGDGGAAALIDHTEERLRAEGFEDAVLWVLDDNPRARAFYERHGWEASGISADHDVYCDLTLPQVEYRKQLTTGKAR